MINKLILDGKVDKFIIRLMIFVNNHSKYNIEYIKDKYNLDSHKDFIKYFKKNYKTKLLFSSYNSELLFINFINIDFKFLFEKYGESYPNKLINFFIAKKKFYFNNCNYLNKHIKENCSCKIKVKSIVNLSIESFIFILKQFYKLKTIKKFSMSDNLEISKNTNISESNINKIKIKNNKNSEGLVKCFKNLEVANDKLGLEDVENHYTLDSLSEIIHNNIENKILQNNDLDNFNDSNKSIKTHSKSKLVHQNQFSSESVFIDCSKSNYLDNDKNNNSFENINDVINQSNLHNSNKSIDTKKTGSSCSSKSENSSDSSDSSNSSDSNYSSSSDKSKSSSSSDKKKNNNINTSKVVSDDSSKIVILENKKDIINYIDIIIKNLETNNNLLFEKQTNIGKLAMELKKNIKNKCSNELATKFDRLYQKTILTTNISDTDDMNDYYNLINQLNEFKKIL